MINDEMMARAFEYTEQWQNSLFWVQYYAKT